MQQYEKDCSVDSNLHFESDQRIIVARIVTLTPKKARRKSRKENSHSKPDLKSLKDTEGESAFVHAVNKELHRKQDLESTDAKIINCIESAAHSTLHKRYQNAPSNDIWKNDERFNLLLKQRKDFVKDGVEYKRVTGMINKRVKFLRIENS